MINPQKIITMTRLALYDKHDGTTDREANDFFRHDYIYKKNLSTRLAVGFGGLIIVLFNLLSDFVGEDNFDIFELDLREHLLDSGLLLIAIIAVYSLIGTIQGTREYYLVQKRLGKYMGMLHYLENSDEHSRPFDESETAPIEGRRERKGKRNTEMQPRPSTQARPGMQPRQTGLPQQERYGRQARPEHPQDRYATRPRQPYQRVVDEMPRSTQRPQEKMPLNMQRTQDNMSQRAPRQALPREPYREPQRDPLANVTNRALNNSPPKPTTPLTSRPPRPASRELPQIRFSQDSSDLPQIRRPSPPPPQDD